MKARYTLFCLIFPLAFCIAQVDTLKYDGMKNIQDGQLFAANRFPGESQIIFNTRFSPVEKCTLQSLLIGMSLVKFDLKTGNDTLIVYVYEDGPVPPNLINIEKTFIVPLGSTGYPNPNINPDNPLSTGDRDLLNVTFNPPIKFSPKRDFLIGVSMKSKQAYPLGPGIWDGFTVLLTPNSPEASRYRRYYLGQNGTPGSNKLVTDGSNVALFMRAVVKYDPTMPRYDPVASDIVASPTKLELEQNYPNPFSDQTTISFSVPAQEFVTLTAYDAMGRQVASLVREVLPAGTHQAVFDSRTIGGNLPAGLYLIRLSAGNITTTRNVLLLR